MVDVTCVWIPVQTVDGLTNPHHTDPSYKFINSLGKELTAVAYTRPQKPERVYVKVEQLRLRLHRLHAATVHHMGG